MTKGDDSSKKVASNRLISQKFLAPTFLLFVAIVSFGIFIPKLGFYMDDWRVLVASRTQGLAGLQKFFAYDARPFAAYFFDGLIKLLGLKPAHWHLYGLLARWLSSVLVWLIIKNTWKNKSVQAIWVAALFLIYPAFFQQQVSVAYSQHWTSFLLYFLSFYLMILSIQKPRFQALFITLSIISMSLELIIIEYFVGLELLRLPIIYVILLEKIPNKKQRIRSTIKAWLPYAMVLVAFVIWRLFFIDLPVDDRNRPEVLFGLFEHPKYFIARLIQMGIQDTINIFVSVWYKTVDPVLFRIDKDPGMMLNWAIWGGVALLAISITAFFLFQNGDDKNQDSRWYSSAIPIGLMGVFLGHAPSWVIGRQAFDGGFWSDRFALPAIFGASIFVVACIDAIFKKYRQKAILISVLIALAVGANLRNTQDFIRSWQMQKDLYWQLIWRAPSIKTPTALFTDNELFPKMGEYPSSMAFSLLYPEDDESRYVNLWLFSINKHFAKDMEKILKGNELYAKTASFEFDVSSKDTLVLEYQPEAHCLWVLSPQDADNPLIPEISRQAAVLSDLGRISSEENSGFPPADIFGKEPIKSWCYYYQKAQLAGQFKQWQEVVRQYELASQLGFVPQSEAEYLSLIEADINLESWDSAQELTKFVLDKNPAMAARLLHLWQSNTSSPVDVQVNMQNNLKKLMRFEN